MQGGPAWSNVAIVMSQRTSVPAPRVAGSRSGQKGGRVGRRFSCGVSVGGGRRLAVGVAAPRGVWQRGIGRRIGGWVRGRVGRRVLSGVGAVSAVRV